MANVLRVVARSAAEGGRGRRPGATILIRSGAWTEECSRIYSERRATEVEWRWSTRARGRTTEPLLSLPGLRGLELRLRGVDDSCVASLTELQELSLIGPAAGNALDLSGLTRVRLAVIDARRQGVTGVRGLPTLEVLTILGSGGVAVGDLIGGPRLETVICQGDGTGPTVSLGDLGESPTLKRFEVTDHVVTDLSGLRALPRLKDLGLIGPRGTGAAAASGSGLDLLPLAEHPSLEWLRIGAQGRLQNLDALSRCRRLRRLSVDEDHVDERDVRRLLNDHPVLNAYERVSGVWHLSADAGV
ncbi:hypothetical protein [Intrasporangium calvum]|uniref:hypothetical protein n=1 Tax=Intrasporangium calvum TaxID=53358 RepID=UPI0012377083|nr:hypothetical protein [Intrasporangium calvum]